MLGDGIAFGWLGAPAGLALASAGWLLAAQHGPVAQLHDGEAALRALAIPHQRQMRDSLDNGSLGGAPALFGADLLGGADLPVKLEGLVRSPHRVAALVSINGGPSDWLAVGETRQAITLDQVQTAGVVVETPTGVHQLALGETLTPTPLQPARIPSRVLPSTGQPPRVSR